MNIPIISGLIDLGAEYIKGRQKIKAAKTEGEVNAMLNASQNAAEWERLQAMNAGNSWKDEFWTIVLSIPMIQEYYHNGFEGLAMTPDWYQYLLGVAVLASFGVKASKHWSLKK